MRQQLCSSIIPVFLVSGLLIATAALSACSSPAQGTRAGEDGVESRGLSRMQQPMQPGMAMKQGMPAQPGAPAQANVQLPTFPKNFEVQGPESDSFGFAVTQAGPIAVEVQAQGAPVVVTLQSLGGGQPITQQGPGLLRLFYNVTAQDVQRSIFWQVQVRAWCEEDCLTAGKRPRAAGVVRVQHPPVDQAAVQQAAQTLAMNKQEIEQANVAAKAHIEQAIAARKAQFAQDQERRLLSDRAKFQPLLDRLRSHAQVRTRGVGEEGEEATEPAQPAEDVTTRDIPDPQSFQKGPKMQYLGPQLKEIPPPPPPQITSLSETSSGPGKRLVVNGSNFSGTVGQVYITKPPDQMVAATILSWTDTGIGIEIPTTITGVMPYGAILYVQRGQDRSNMVTFNFIPKQDQRTIYTIPGDRRHSGSFLTYPNPRNTQMDHTRIYGIPFGEFAGEKGNDEFFLLTQLKNGWMVSAVRFFPPREYFPPTTPNALQLNALMDMTGGAYVEQQRGGTHPYMNIRWWINPFAAAVTYRYQIDIVGPEGVPDGIVVP